MSNADKTTMNDRRKELTEDKTGCMNSKEGTLIIKKEKYWKDGELLDDVKEYNTQKYARTVNIKV